MCSEQYIYLGLSSGGKGEVFHLSSLQKRGQYLRRVGRVDLYSGQVFFEEVLSDFLFIRG